MRERAADLCWRLALPVGGVIAWVGLSRVLTSPTWRLMMPPPEALYESLSGLLTPEVGTWMPGLLLHMRESLIRLLTGFGAAAAVAIPLGIAVGRSRLVETNLNPLIQSLRPISPIAWIPIALTWFGVGTTTVAFVVSYGSFFPILLNTIAGVKGTNRLYIRAALICGLPAHRLLLKVILPAALPAILTGLRIGSGVGWMTIVAAELVGTNTGLGYLISEARFHLDIERIILGMMAIGILGVLTDRCLRKLQAVLVPWHGK